METLPQLQEIKSITTSIEEVLPKLKKGHDNSLAVLSEITAIDSDEAFESANTDLADVRTAFKKMQDMRMSITKKMDDAKDFLMSFEKPISNDAKANNEYNRVRKLMEAYQQKKLEGKRRADAEIVKRKDLENHKVDLKAKMLENLTTNVAETIKAADQYAKTLFDNLPLEIFDEEAGKFSKSKPKLKQDKYDNCFAVAYRTDLLTKEEFDAMVAELKQQEPYETWNSAVIEAVSPILNEWRAKIPDIKAEKEKIAAAQGEEKIRLEAEAKAKSDLELQQRQQSIDQAAKDQKNEIAQAASMDKMSNEFASQAASQNLDDAGKVKLILKFKDPKTTPQALFAIMYHVFSHKDFPGIQKRDKTKKLIFDDKGRPEYIEPVQWWIDFFMTNCDAHIENTVITEDAKITVRR